MSDAAFITAVCLAHVTGTLNGIAIGLWVSDKVTQFLRKREQA